MGNIIRITGYTIRDQMRQRSFYVLLAVSLLLVLMLRGCYGGSYTVNGQQVSGQMVAWQASKIAFHLIVVCMFLLSAMLSMKIFSRDQDDGSTVQFLSRPVYRWHYVLGRLSGTWLISAAFMFLLHCTIFLTAWSKTGGTTPAFLWASLVSSINLLFVIVCICVLSLYMPDFVSALFTLGVIAVGFVSDGGFQLMQNPMVQNVMPSGGAAAHPALWRVVFPKIFMVQSYAASLISNSEFHGMGPVHPILNVFFFIALLTALLLAAFNKKEI